MFRAIRSIVLFAVCLNIVAFAQTGTGSTAPQPAGASSPSSQTFDIGAAVDAYLAKMPPDQRARSDAYFEGGYWLLLWDFLRFSFRVNP